MAIRVTQQYVDVFGAVSGTLRVSRQLVEVLHDAGVASTNVSANSTMNLVHSVAREIPLSVTTTLNASDEASGVSETPGITVNVSHTINFISSEFEFNYTDDRQVPYNTISLSDEVHAEGYEDPSHTLNLTQAVELNGPISLNAFSQLILSDSALSRNKYATASNDISWYWTVGIPIPVSASNTISFISDAYMLYADDIITFSDSAEAAKSKGVEVQDLGLTQTVSVRGTFRISVADVLGVGHALTYFEDTPCNRKNYAPFSGDNTISGLSMPTSKTYPQYTGADRFKIYWPSRGGRSEEVIIRAPNFGNIGRTKHSRVNRETRGGKIIVYNDPVWPSVKSINVTMQGLLKEDVDALYTLVYNHIGQLLGFTDWEGYEWEGILTNPDDPYTNDGKDMWTVTLTFEGDIIEGYSPGHILDASQALTSGKDPGANTDMNLTDIVGGAWPEGSKGNDLSLIHSASGVVV